MIYIKEKFDEVLGNKLEELFNPNDNSAEFSNRFMQALHKPKDFNPFDLETYDGEEVEHSTDPMEFMEQLHRAVHEEDDEIEIEYETGEHIIIDVNVAKHILANCNAEQICLAATHPVEMHQLLSRIFDEIIVIDPESASEISKETK